MSLTLFGSIQCGHCEKRAEVLVAAQTGAVGFGVKYRGILLVAQLPKGWIELRCQAKHYCDDPVCHDWGVKVNAGLNDGAQVRTGS